jgi:hypothetical protein
MSFRSNPIFIPNRVSRAQQTESGPPYQANGQLNVGRSDHGTSPTLNQDPHTPDIDTVYGSVSPLISTFGSSLPEPSWAQFDVNRILYSANNSPESSFRVGRSGNMVADEALLTIENTMPHSTPLMSQDRDFARNFVGIQSIPSAPIPPGHTLPINTEYVHFGNVLTSHTFCLLTVSTRYDPPDLICGWTGCSYDGGFSRKASLWRHIQDQHLRKDLRCSMCPESFGRKDKFIMHLRHVHSDIGMN